MAGSASAPAPSALKATPAGSKPATTAIWSPAPPLCWPTNSAKVSGYPANFHVRNFLDCVKSRAQTRANAEAACQSHITCHAANIALLLKRKVRYDPVKNEFIGDEQANRLRSEALREPWRL